LPHLAPVILAEFLAFMTRAAAFVLVPTPGAGGHIFPHGGSVLTPNRDRQSLCENLGIDSSR
jgi:hypothetical protein